MRRLTPIVLAAFCLTTGVLFSRAQQANNDSTMHFTLQSQIPLNGKDLETDRLGNIYVLNQTNQLYKYSPSGKLLSTLNFNYQGNVGLIDPSNPMEIYLFYRELNKVLFLDNNLAYRGECDLSAFGMGQTSAIARAYDNSIWVFDQSDLQLKKISKDGKVSQMSGNIRQYTNSDVISPGFICDNGSRVFVNDSLNGVLVFDLLCNYIKTIALRGCNRIKVIDENIFYFKDSLVFRYNTTNFKTTSSVLPINGKITDISIEKNRLYLLKEEEVLIYAF